MLQLTEKSYVQTIFENNAHLPQYTPPADWVTEFAALIFAALPNKSEELRQIIEQKLSRQITIMPKLHLENLQHLYGVMAGKFSSHAVQYSHVQAPAFAEKLFEGMINCGPGFQNRIGELLQGIQCVENMGGRLQLMREDIVKTTASTLTDEVHTRNAVSRVAHKHYGVRTFNSHAPYSGSISPGSIESKLTSEFKSKYTPIGVLQYIEEQIRHEVQLLGYTGRLGPHMSYLAQEYSGFIEHFNKLFDVNLGLSEWILTRGDLKTSGEDDALSDFDVIDIHWNKIREHLLNKLEQEKFINLSFKQFLATDLSQPSNDEEIKYLLSCCSNEEIKRKLELLISKNKYIEAFKIVVLSDLESSQLQLHLKELLAKASTKDLADGFRGASQNGHLEIVKAFIEGAQSQQILREMLLAGNTEDGLALGFRSACQNGRLEIAKVCIEATQPKLLQEMLLAEHPQYGPALGFRWACKNGHLNIVKACIEAAQSQPKLLRDMLLAGNPNYGPAIGFLLACEKGHVEIAKACIEAAQSQPKLLQDMLLAGHREYGPAYGFRMACKNGHRNIVKACIEATLSQPKLLQNMLLAGNPKDGPALGFRRACEMRHLETVNAVLSATQENTHILNILISRYSPMINSPFFYRLTTDPQGLFKMLVQLEPKQQRIVLNDLQINCSTKKRQSQFMDMMRDLIDTSFRDLHDNLITHYLDHASIFSLMRLRITIGLFFGFYSQEKIKEELSQRMRSNWSGASMLSGLSLYKSIPKEKKPTLHERWEKTKSNTDEFPDEFMCPITFELFNQPIYVPSENNIPYFFEKKCLANLIKKARENKSNTISHPITQEKISIDKVLQYYRSPENCKKREACAKFVDETEARYFAENAHKMSS